MGNIDFEQGIQTIGTEYFQKIMLAVIDAFKYIYTLGQMLLVWLSTPLEEQYPGAMEFIGEEIASYSPMEFAFGAGLIIALIYGMVKFFMPF